MRLWIDYQLLIDDWNDHSGTLNQGTIELVAGHRHDAQLEYYEDGGFAHIRLEWSSPSQPQEVIPPSCLYPNQGASISLAVLEQELLQPLGQLPIRGDLVDQDLSQPRLCAEIIRAYLESRPPSEDRKAILARDEEAYR